MRFLRRLPWRPVPFTLAAAALVASRQGAGVNAAAPGASAGLVEALRMRGLETTVADVSWTNGPDGLAGALRFRARALVRAHTPGEPSDLYLVEARLAPEGTLLDVGSAWNLTRTSGVDEARPILRGGVAATSTSVDGVVTGVHTFHLRGRPAADYVEFSRVQRAQIALQNLQQTGQTAGVVHDSFALDPVADAVTLAFRDDGSLAVKADDRAIVIDTYNAQAVEGAGWVRAAPEQKARPGNVVTWSVDRVRNMPWFGEEKMQWVKAIVFTGIDYAKRAKQRVFPAKVEDEPEDELAAVMEEAKGAPTFTDPESGWPPAAIPSILKPPLPNEGQWVVLDKDPFITPSPGNPAGFVTTFVRADKQRPTSRVYVTLWDPRQIALHMEAGTVEPVSATGEAGAGVIPRTPEVLRTVVAGFNGGFQAIHGEFGMQANGILYLPPKPYAATVFELRDGSTAFGSWPNDPRVPDEVLSYRQNMTALLENGRMNPWGRTWWGGTPPGWSDNIHTTRSALCLTSERFVGYFWGESISHDVLAQAMLAARCTYAVHLDMNPGLAGFEFYNVAAAPAFAPLGRPLQSDWEHEGYFRELPEFKYRARRMIKGMQHQNFPQYIHRDARDFFYLTRRPILPGPDLAPDAPWRVRGLPQHGFPYALATTELRPDPKDLPELKARVLRLDPRTVRMAGAHGTTDTTPTVASIGGVRHTPKTGELVLWFAAGVFTVGPTAPTGDATAIAVGVPPQLAHATAKVAVGVQDEDGMLVWAEAVHEAKDAGAHDERATRALDALLARLGCTQRLLVRGDPRVLLGGSLDLAGAPAAAIDGPVTRLVRGEAPGARRTFEDVAIVGPNVWMPLQAQRVRYFKKPTRKAPDAGAPKAAPPSPAPAASE